MTSQQPITASEDASRRHRRAEELIHDLVAKLQEAVVERRSIGFWMPVRPAPHARRLHLDSRAAEVHPATSRTRAA